MAMVVGEPSLSKLVCVLISSTIYSNMLQQLYSSLFPAFPHSSISLATFAGLNRCGKSCRLRWTNYLRPDIKRGKFSQEEEQTILHLHSILGNKYFPCHIIILNLTHFWVLCAGLIDSSRNYVQVMGLIIVQNSHISEFCVQKFKQWLCKYK